MEMKRLAIRSENHRLIAMLNTCGVRYLVIGGTAVSFYVKERVTYDLDILLEATPDNAARVFNALGRLDIPRNFKPERLSEARRCQIKLHPAKSEHRGFHADLITTDLPIHFEDEIAAASEARIGDEVVLIASRELNIHLKSNSDRETQAEREKDNRDILYLRRSA